MCEREGGWQCYAGVGGRGWHAVCVRVEENDAQK